MANLDDMNKSLDDITRKLEYILELQERAIRNNVVLQTRVAEQRDAPVRAAIELLRKIQNKDDSGKDYISEETYEEIDAVLNMAAGG